MLVLRRRRDLGIYSKQHSQEAAALLALDIDDTRGGQYQPASNFK